jgi:ribonuclease HI
MSQIKITSFFKKPAKIIPLNITTNTNNRVSPNIDIFSYDNKSSPENLPSPTPIQGSPIVQYCMMFDGCSKGNPGPAGAGAVIYSNNIEIWSRAIYVGNRETNNIAEYTGLLLGLNEAVRRNIRVLIVKGDSEVVIKQMQGKYKVKSENLVDIYNQAKELEHRFDKIEYMHVYRNYNTRADALSNEGLAKIHNVK